MGQRLYKRADSPNWYTTINGRGVSTGCRDKRAAEARSIQLERAAFAPRPASNAPTLAAALERALADRAQRGRAEGTLHMWRIKCGQLLRVIGSETSIADIVARTVDDYQATRHADGAADATVAKEIGCLSVALKIARRRGEYPHDPAAVLPVELHRESKARDRYLSPEEARRLLDDLLNDELVIEIPTPGPKRGKASRRPPVGETTTLHATRARSMKNRAARLAFILATSARWSESDRARREDVLVGADGLGFVTLRGSKTDGASRVVPILPTTAPLLRIALEHGGDGLLFDPWTNVRSDIARASRRLRIPTSSPNDWRRTTATWLYQAGVEPHLIALVLGHADGRMVERKYGRMTPEALSGLLRERVGDVVPAGALPEGKGRRRVRIV